MNALRSPATVALALFYVSIRLTWAGGSVPSEKECTEFAKRLEASINELDPTLFDTRLDLDAMLSKAAGGLGLPESALANFRKGARRTALGKRLGVSICDKIEEHSGSYKLLRIHTVDGSSRALFRMAGDDGVNYHDLVLTRAAGGGVEIADLYSFAAGELSSQIFRRILVGVPTHTKPIHTRELPQNVRDLARKMAVVKTAGDLAKQGKFAEALGAFSALPPGLQKDKLMLIHKLGIARQAGDDEYEKAIASFEKHYPNDPALLLISIDGRIMTREYAKALAAVDRLDKVVGGDPYLDIVRSTIHLEAGDAKKAESFAESAVRRESSLEQAHWALLTVRLERKDFAGVVRALTEMEEALECEVEGLEEDEAYAEFVKTKDYREWLESRRASKTAPVGIAPAE